MLPSLHSPGSTQSLPPPHTSFPTLTPTSNTSPPSSLTSQRHRAQTFSSFPTSSVTAITVPVSEQSSIYHPEHHYSHHTSSHDSISKRKRGRMSQLEGFGNVESSAGPEGPTPPIHQRHSTRESIHSSQSSLNISDPGQWIKNTNDRPMYSLIQGAHPNVTHRLQQSPRVPGQPRERQQSLSIPTIKISGQNKRPLILSPSPTSSSFNLEDHSWQQKLHPEHPRLYGRPQEQDRGSKWEGEQSHAAQLHQSDNAHTPSPVQGTSSSAPSTTIPTLSFPMPHFRAQPVQQRMGSSSHMRRFYSSASVSSSTSSLAYSASSRSSPSIATSASKSAADKKRQLGESMPFDDAGHAGLDSDQDITAIRVLVELLNGILKSHNAFATRDNISSQEQPITFRPTVLNSLVHLRELMTLATTSLIPRTTELCIGTSTSPKPPLSPARFDAQSIGAIRQRSSPLQPSGLSKSTVYMEREDLEAATGRDVGMDQTQTRSNASTSSSSGQFASSILQNEEAAEMYNSTVEFLAQMTAFVSVVCWLMQTLLSIKTSEETTELRGMGNDPYRHKTVHNTPLQEFLSLFDDQDNVLKPISDTLAGRDYHDRQRNDNDPGLDPVRQAGLFAWHFYLFASDPGDPLVKEGQAIAIQGLQAVHFDVILNELYTTHVLSKTVKEHQKDHGQFYTPPGIVEFMWNRTLRGRGNMLDRLVETIRSDHSRNAESTAPASSSPGHMQGDSMCHSLQKEPFQDLPLIPTALDPCLGVSTFLSGYIRLLIQEARASHDSTIWNSEAASRLLLHQICEYVWGIELDGFAFWMARCGVIAALMPLVQRVQELSQIPAQRDILHLDASISQQRNLRLPRLHLFLNDTLQLNLPNVVDSRTKWESECILRLRKPTQLQFDFIVTNPPYMIRKTGTFSAPDPEVYDWNILGSNFAANVGTHSSTSGGPGTLTLRGSKTKRGRKAKVINDSRIFVDEGALSATDTGDDGTNESEPEATTPDSGASTARSVLLQKPVPKGMMQAYGYFILFAAQRVKPYTGVSCMITASQWLTLGFASKLRAWLFENCIMDEFFQFEPFKVFPKVQTDSLIFKIRALDMSSSNPSVRDKVLQDHSTMFLRHTDHHKPLAEILRDYMEFSTSNASMGPNNDLSIMASTKTRQELSVSIAAPPSNLSVPSVDTTGVNFSSLTTTIPTWTYSFAPMMPSSGLTTYLLSLTQDLGGICSAGTKLSRLSAVEPLLWHRGPNTNPVYGLVTRMEYARTNFGESMTDKWFRSAFYWNGKNSPDELATSGGDGDGVASKTHKEGLFWKNRDRVRLSKKEGSPAESYLVPKPDPQRQYALCMIDKESVKTLKRQVELGIEGSFKLWSYLKDVRNHFQPGLASRKSKVAPSGGRQSADDDGVAFCSTNQCGSDVQEKIIHPINYGYFSKTQPRQRFFLDSHQHAVTNQCIYLTLNKLSHHYNAEQSPSLIYFLMLLNSSTLQFFILHCCQYDQQGRMRLFRDSMAKIPFQDRDVKHNPDRVRYASQLGEHMIELKGLLYQVVSCWRLSGSHRSHDSALGNFSNRRGGSAVSGKKSSKSSESPYGASTGPSGGNHGLLDWIRRGGDAPTGVLARVKEQIRNMLMADTMTAIPTTQQKAWYTHSSPPYIAGGGKSSPSMAETDSETNTSTDTDTDTDDNIESRIQVTRTQPVTGRLVAEDRSSLSDSEIITRNAPTWQSDSRHPHTIPHKASEHAVDPLRTNYYDPGTSPAETQAMTSTTGDSGAYMRNPISIHPRHKPLAPSFASGSPISPALPDSTASAEPISAPHSQSENDHDVSSECDKILQAIERAVAMVELIQWAVDQYGYMLYGIQPKFQKLLELELKLVYSSTVEALVASTSPTSSPSDVAVSDRTSGPGDTSSLPQIPLQQLRQPELRQQEAEVSRSPGAAIASRLGIMVSQLHRWSEDDKSGGENDINASGSTSSYAKIPSYAESVLENAKTTAQDLRNLLQRYPCLPVENMTV
ncbi:hypothetical protein BGZ79_001890 [Entomortierella chlamydospora]|nr:hypothetical protein BGZ79_001890 [Entomortierella chlamydospora]